MGDPNIIIDMEGGCFLKPTIVVTTAAAFETACRKIMRSGTSGHVLSYDTVSTSPSFGIDSIPMIEYRDPSPSAEEDGLRAEKIELARKIDKKNWLKASDKPWQKRKGFK